MPDLLLVKRETAANAQAARRPHAVRSMGDAVAFIQDPRWHVALYDPGQACRFDSPVYTGRILGRLQASNCILAYLILRAPDLGLSSICDARPVRLPEPSSDLLTMEIETLKALEDQLGWDLVGPRQDAAGPAVSEKQRRLATLRCLLTHLARTSGSDSPNFDPVIDLTSSRLRGLTGDWL